VKLRALLAAAVVLAMVTSAQAVQLVVMSVNTTAVAGAKVFTIGVKVSQSDVTAPGAGNNPPLFAQGITFTGTGTNPIQATPTAANKQDVQSIQTAFIDTSAGNNGGPPSPNLGSVNGAHALYNDSWWYNGAGGSLQGVIDSAGDPGTVTTNPATDGSGVYTVGPTFNVGSTGYIFQAEGTPPNPSGGAATGATMGYTGLFGPTGANGLDQSPLAGQFVSGFLTVAIAQIVTTGNLALPDSYTAGTGTFLSVGQKAYDLSGAPAGTDTAATLDFASGQIVFSPEPGTIVLAGLGVVGLLFAWKRRK